MDFSLKQGFGVLLVLLIGGLLLGSITKVTKDNNVTASNKNTEFWQKAENAINPPQSEAKMMNLVSGKEFTATIPESVTSIEFGYEVAPEDVILTDLSVEKNMGIVGWTDGDTYKVSTQDANNIISFNEDCSLMFFPWDYNSRISISNIYFENIDTSKVTNMSNMFYYCENITSLDLSKFDTSKVTNMTSMFCSCKKLKIIYVSNLWNVKQVTTNNKGMFKFNYDLVGQSGQKYDSSKIDTTMANYKTGYLTYKPYSN